MDRKKVQYRWCHFAGLTFGEMLVVLAVFSILAVLFFLSSNHVMTKTRAARALHEQKMIRDGLANYQAVNLRLPDEMRGLVEITRPIRYLQSIPQDPFHIDKSIVSDYEYYTNISEKHPALIVSVGPDGDSDIGGFLKNLKTDNSSLAGVTAPGSKTLLLTDPMARKFIIEHSYDPTNGSTSNGDIITIF
jgi:type II secretory pathway pseudopilin PulG